MRAGKRVSSVAALAIAACAQGELLDAESAGSGAVVEAGTAETGGAANGGAGGGTGGTGNAGAGTAGWSGSGGSAASGGAGSNAAGGSAGEAGAESGGASGSAGFAAGGGSGTGGSEGAASGGSGGALGAGGSTGVGGSAGSGGTSGAPQTITLEGDLIEDTHSDDGSPSATHGGDALFRIDEDDSGDVMNAYVRATSLAALPTDGSATIVSATLELRCIDGNGGSEVTVKLVTAAWTEAALAWSNQPAVGATVSSFTPSCGNSVEEVDIATAVTAWAQGQPNYGIRLKGTGTNGSDWRSTEDGNSAYRPRIVITFR